MTKAPTSNYCTGPQPGLALGLCLPVSPFPHSLRLSLGVSASMSLCLCLCVWVFVSLRLRPVCVLAVRRSFYVVSQIRTRLNSQAANGITLAFQTR